MDVPPTNSSSNTPSTGSHSDVPKYLPRKRRMSAPPLNFHDLLDQKGKRFFSRSEDSEALSLDPKDLASFESAYRTTLRLVKSTKSTKIYFGEDKVLKTYSYLVDVGKIVQNMELARTKVPVPYVWKYGYSGNCGYILMERVEGYSLSDVLRHRMSPPPPAARIPEQIRKVVEDLASLGICHNDLKPRNIMVDRRWRITGVVDWDNCTPLIHGGEYTKRVVWPERDSGNPLVCRVEDWDVMFLGAAVDRLGEELLREGREGVWGYTAPLRGMWETQETFGPQTGLAGEWKERVKARREKEKRL